ncbi:MAG: archease [Acidobacteria bacterium]|nr:archease [Acidobacteriota bacterium]
MADYEILEHTADIGFRATAATPAELFRNAARAMMAIAVDPETLSGDQERTVTVTGDGYPDLMVNWLSEVLYFFDSDEFAGRDFRVDEITENRLCATIIGEPRDPQRHTWELIIKAITYHQLKVEEVNGRWQAEVFLDI